MNCKVCEKRKATGRGDEPLLCSRCKRLLVALDYDPIRLNNLIAYRAKWALLEAIGTTMPCKPTPSGVTCLTHRRYLALCQSETGGGELCLA